jgi:hypothetical protein
VSTPRPAVPYGPETIQTTRTLPDGREFYNAVEDLFTQGIGNWWGLPTPPGEQAMR